VFDSSERFNCLNFSNVGFALMYFKIEDNPAFIHYNSINLMVIGLSQHEHDKLVACSKSNEKDAF